MAIPQVRDWTWQNEALTFIVQSPGRGYKAIAETFPNGFPDVVPVHHCREPHYKFNFRKLKKP